MEIERGQVWIQTFEKLRRSFIGRQICCFGSSEIEFDAMKETLMFADVRRAQALKRLPARASQVIAGDDCRISGRVFVASVAGRSRDQQQCGICLADNDFLVMR